MAGVRADWHLDVLDSQLGGDPMQELMALTAASPVIDLSRTEPELTADLAALLTKEGRYAAFSTDEHGQPLQCELKWSDQHILQNPQGDLSCFNCPHHTEDRAEARSLVCALGRRQEGILEHLRSFAVVSSLDEELVAAYADEIEAAAELAEACLV